MHNIIQRENIMSPSSPSSTEDKIQSLISSSSAISLPPSNNKNVTNDSETALKFLRKEKEELDEPKYRQLFRDLIQEHEGILRGNLFTRGNIFKNERDESNDNADDDVNNIENYEAETNMLRDVLANERRTAIVAMGVSLLTFGVLRVAPKRLIKRIGGPEKIAQLEKAERLAKENGTAGMQTMIGIFIESTFSIFVGMKVYHRLSETNKESYDTLSSIPLVEGRSKVSDELCPSWVRLTKQQIPSGFWKKLDDGSHKLGGQEATWHAIRQFSNNCIKRKLYERSIRKDLGIADHTIPVSLPNGVPAINNDFVEILTSEEALRLVSDS